MKRNSKSSLGMFLMALITVGTLTSCAFSSTEEQLVNSELTRGLVLNIKTTSVGNTRTALTSVTSANEQVVQNMVVGLFKSDGTTVHINSYTQSDLSSTSANGLSHNLTTSYTASTASTKQIEVGDRVLVAINIPDARLTDFTSAADLDDFQEQSLSIAEAITHSSTGTAIDEDALPMYGEGTVAASGTTFRADVTVIHTVAKVTLASLTADFSESLHTNAAFTPTEVFLLNVPDATDFGYTWTSGGIYTYNFGKIDDATSPVTNYYTGESSLTTGGTFPTNTATVQQFQADYIGSEVLILSALQTSSPSVGGYTFYTLPNNSTTYNTKLVIKGKYTDDITLDATGHDAYYAANLYPDYATDATSKSILPNYNYSVTAVIKGDGSDDAYTSIPNIESLKSTVTALPFDEYQTTAIFNNGVTYEALPPVNVGDYYYSDGTWSTAYDASKTVIGLVFSTDVSDADYASGFTHGYVVALDDVNNSAKYAWSTDLSTITGMDLLEVSDYVALDGTHYTGDEAHAHAIMENYDGYTFTKYIVDNKTIADFPAFNAAVNTYESVVPAPKSGNAGVLVNSSGWYLPSTGQTWKLCYNFCNYTTTWPSTNYQVRNTAAYHDISYPGMGDITNTNLNAYLEKRLNTDVVAAGGTAIVYTPFIQRTTTNEAAWWLCNEHSASRAFWLDFWRDGQLLWDSNFDKSRTYYVRAVLAF